MRPFEYLLRSYKPGVIFSKGLLPYSNDVLEELDCPRDLPVVEVG